MWCDYTKTWHSIWHSIGVRCYALYIRDPPDISTPICVDICIHKASEIAFPSSLMPGATVEKYKDKHRSYHPGEDRTHTHTHTQSHVIGRETSNIDWNCKHTHKHGDEDVGDIQSLFACLLSWWGGRKRLNQLKLQSQSYQQRYYSGLGD